MRFDKALLGALLLCCAATALAQEAVLRKNLAARLPTLPKIEEVNKTPMNGLYEIKVQGNDIYYTDAKGDFLFQGELIDTKQKRNLTEERNNKLSAIAFDSLPLKHAFTQVRGNGKRKLVVFADPNCGYCKRFERDLASIKDVTIHMFLYPILGADSTEKSRSIWCAKDKNKTWTDWMVKDIQPPSAAASCDSTALTRNVEFGKRLKITGTPTLVFADGSRVPGAINTQQIEKMLSEAKP